MDETIKTSVNAVLDDFGDALKMNLVALRLAFRASPFGKPFSRSVHSDSGQVMAECRPAPEMAQVTWVDQISLASPSPRMP